MIEFGDLFDANLNPVTDPIYKPLEKEFKALFNEFSKEDADEQEHPDEQKCHSEQNHPDAQDKYDERISQYRSVVPDSSNLKEELISFFENEGIVKNSRLHFSEENNAIAEDLSSDKDSLSSTLPPPLAALSMSYINLLMTPLAPVYTIDNFIQNLCFLNNPDCPVVIQQTSAFWDDIFNALIFNLNYENRESLNTSDDSIALHTLYTLYESSVGESICHSIIPESNWTTNFCQYSMSAFFTYDATHQLPDRSYARSRPFYSVFNTLHEDSSKARTFRNVLNAISCSENLTPRAEDQWYLEKVLGISTVAAIYPFVAKYTISKTEAVEITTSILHVLMKCQPLRTRIFLAKVMSGAASNFQHLFQNNNTSCNQIYSATFQKVLLEPLRKTVDFVNQVYFTTLKAFYDAVHANLIPIAKIKDYYDRVDNLDPYLSCVADSAYYGLSKKNIRGLKALFYPQDASQFILDFFPLPDATVKTIALSRNDTALFSLLQTTAIKEILTNYNIPY